MISVISSPGHHPSRPQRAVNSSSASKQDYYVLAWVRPRQVGELQAEFQVRSARPTAPWLHNMAQARGVPVNDTCPASRSIIGIAPTDFSSFFDGGAAEDPSRAGASATDTKEQLDIRGKFRFRNHTRPGSASQRTDRRSGPSSMSSIATRGGPLPRFRGSTADRESHAGQTCRLGPRRLRYSRSGSQQVSSTSLDPTATTSATFSVSGRRVCAFFPERRAQHGALFQLKNQSTQVSFNNPCITLEGRSAGHSSVRSPRSRVYRRPRAHGSEGPQN